MTAPTSPGVVPADDVLNLAKRLRQEAAKPENASSLTMIEAARMLERLANRPSLTEDEREQVRREALEEAENAVEALKDFSPVVGDRQRFTLRDIEIFSRGFLRLALEDIRALADRSEPRQEMEGDRG